MSNFPFIFKILSPIHAVSFANCIPNHTLHLLEGADHNYQGMHEPLVDIILNYFSDQESKERFWEEILGFGGKRRCYP